MTLEKMIAKSRIEKTMTLSGMFLAAMFSGAGSAAAAGGNYSVLPDTVDNCPEEADTCQSDEDVEIKSCEVQYGKGSMPVYNLETGDFMHCATTASPQATTTATWNQ